MFNEVIELDPHQLAAYYKLAKSLYLIKKYWDSIDVLNKGIILYPSETKLLVYKANSLCALKRY